MSKYPSKYNEPIIGEIKDPFRPEFKYDSRGRLVMPLPGYSRFMLAVEPGSKRIGQSSEDEAGNPGTEPNSLKTGYLHVASTIKLGPEGGWVMHLSGGDAEYPISYMNEATEVVNFYVDKDGNVYLKGTIVAEAGGTIGGFTIRSDYLESNTSPVACGLAPLDWPFWAGALYANRAAAPFRVNNDGDLFAESVEVAGKIVSGAGSEIEWTHLQNVAIVNADIVNLSADKINAGTLTAITVQTGVPEGTNKVIRLSSVNTHLIEFMYGVDVIGNIECTYNIANDFAGVAISGGGGTWFSASGTANIGGVQIGLANKYFGLAWEAGDSATERIITNAEIDSDWVPYQAGYNLGGVAAAEKWQHLYLSGNIVVGGTVDGVDIAAHDGGAIGTYHTGIISNAMHGTKTGIPSAHHVKTTTLAHSAISGITSDQHHAQAHTHISDAIIPASCRATGAGTGTNSAISGQSFCTTVGRIYFGSYLMFDFYSTYMISQVHLDPLGAGALNLGGATRWWDWITCNDINKKTGGGAGWLYLDDGVELQDGRKVSDVRAIEEMKPLKGQLSKNGQRVVDFRTLPKIIYRQARYHDGKLMKRDKKDRPYFLDKDGKKTITKDGEDVFATISLLLGAVRELSNINKELDNRLKKLGA